MNINTESDSTSLKTIESPISSIAQSYHELHNLWRNTMGDETWPIYEACLSATCTLYLQHMRQPMCLIIKGKSSSGKTTILNLFKNLPDNRSEYIDEVSAAGFVSQSGKVDQGKLDEIDLLPRLRNRLLITPEMGTMFSRNENDLRQNFGTLLRILDGDGLIRHGGIHGTRGYEGEYKFVFLAATVTVPSNAWAMMRESGTRILFINMPASKSRMELVQKMQAQLSGDGVSPNDLKNLQLRTSEHFAILDAHNKIRSMPDPIMPEDIQSKLILLSTLGTRLRAEIVKESNSSSSFMEKEEPFRLMHQLAHLMYGRVIVRGAHAIENQDFGIARQIALHSAPEGFGDIIHWLLFNPRSDLKAVTANTSFGITKTAELLSALTTLQVVRKDGGENGKAGYYSILPDWSAIS